MTYSQAVGFIADEFATDTFRSLPKEWFALTKAKITNRFKK